MLDKVLEQIDTQEFLDYFGGCKNFSRNGEWINCNCPIHADHNPSFGMHTKSKIWKCFVCGSGDAISYIQKVRGISRTEAIQKIYEFAANVFEEEDFDPERLQKKIRSILALEKELKILPEYDASVIEQWRYIHPYMIERGFEDPSIYHNFKCGYSKEHDKLTFPIFIMDKLMGVQSRRLDNEKPKYMPIPGYEFKQGKLIYNLCPEYDRVVVVEGILDCIRLWSYGALNAISIFSSHMSIEQAQTIIDNFDEVILWLDRDQAGEAGTINAINELGGHIKIFVAGFYGRKTDPAEHTLQETMVVRANTIPATKWLMQRRL